MSVIKKLIGQTAVYGLLTIVARFINLLLVPLHTHYLTAEMYGKTGIFYSYIALAMIILTYGMETTFFNFARKKEFADKVYGTSFLSLQFTSVFFLALGILFNHHIAWLIGKPDAGQLVLYMFIILAFDAMSAIPLALFRLQEKTWKFTIVRVSGILLSILLNFYFIAFCPWLIKHGYIGFYNYFYNPNHLVEYIFIANMVSSIFVYLCCIYSTKNEAIKFDFSLLKKMLWYTWPLIFVGTAGVINETVDRILIDKLMPNGEYYAGIYNAFYKISIVITLMVQAFRMGAEPFFFTHLSSANRDKIYAVILKYFTYCCTVVFLITALFAEQISVILIRNPKYFENKDGLFIVPILLLANVFLGIYYNLSIWYKAENKTGYGAIIAIIGAIITLSINIVFIPLYGIIAAAFATLCCYFVMTVISYLWGQQHLPIKYEWFKILGIIFSACGFVAFFNYSGFSLSSNPTIGYVIKWAAILLYLSFWLWIERHDLKQLLKKQNL